MSENRILQQDHASPSYASNHYSSLPLYLSPPLLVSVLMNLLAAGIGFLTYFAQSDLSPRTTPLIKRWIIAWWVLTMSTNILCTCAMAYRIIRAQRGITSVDQRTGHVLNLGGIVVVLIESAALYTVTTTAAMICLILNQTGTWTIYSMVCSFFPSCNMLITSIFNIDYSSHWNHVLHDYSPYRTRTIYFNILYSEP